MVVAEEAKEAAGIVAAADSMLAAADSTLAAKWAPARREAMAGITITPTMTTTTRTSTTTRITCGKITRRCQRQ